MGKEDIKLIEWIIVGIFYITLCIALLYRILKGPNVVDRAVAGDCIDLMTAVALVTFAIYCDRSIYLDVGLILAILGFLSTVLIAKYLEGKL